MPDWVVGAGIFLLVFFMPAAGCVALVSASGERDYCYIKHIQTCGGELPNEYWVKANVPWREDRTVSVEHSLDAAVAVAERIGCPLK